MRSFPLSRTFEQSAFAQDILGAGIVFEQFINQFASNGHRVLLVSLLCLPSARPLSPSSGAPQSTMPLNPVKAASLAWFLTITPELGQKIAGLFAAQLPSPAASFQSFIGSDHLHKPFYSPQSGRKTLIPSKQGQLWTTLHLWDRRSASAVPELLVSQPQGVIPTTNHSLSTRYSRLARFAPFPLHKLSLEPALTSVFSST